jgi:hypothetical protein
MRYKTVIEVKHPKKLTKFLLVAGWGKRGNGLNTMGKRGDASSCNEMTEEGQLRTSQLAFGRINNEPVLL